VLATFVHTAIFEPLAGNVAAKFDPAKFSYVGNMDEGVGICGVSKAAGIATFVLAEREAALREAFIATANDPQFLADAMKTGIDIGPSTGEEIEAFIERVSASSPDVMEHEKGSAQRVRRAAKTLFYGPLLKGVFDPRPCASSTGIMRIQSACGISSNSQAALPNRPLDG
jgi:hypothetical protein